MTDLHTAARMAMEALEHREAALSPDEVSILIALRQALDQPQPEPVAWLVCSVNSDGSLSVEHAAAWEEAAHEHINDAITEFEIEGADKWVVRPAYTTPPRRKWVGLTDEEAMQIIDAARNGSTSTFGFMRVARAIEARLKERNA